MTTQKPETSEVPMRLLRSWISALADKFCASMNERPILSYVRISNTHIDATNSFIAAHIQLPENPNAEKYPAKGNRVQSLKTPILFPAKTIKQIKWKVTPGFPDIDRKAVLVEEENWMAWIEVTDLDTTITYSGRTWNRYLESFPDLTKFYENIRATPSQNTVALDINYMMDALLTMKAMGIEMVNVEIRETQGLIITPMDADPSDDSFMIVMPLKSNNQKN